MSATENRNLIHKENPQVRNIPKVSKSHIFVIKQNVFTILKRLPQELQQEVLCHLTAQELQKLQGAVQKSGDRVQLDPENHDLLSAMGDTALRRIGYLTGKTLQDIKVLYKGFGKNRNWIDFFMEPDFIFTSANLKKIIEIEKQNNHASLRVHTHIPEECIKKNNELSRMLYKDSLEVIRRHIKMFPIQLQQTVIVTVMNLTNKGFLHYSIEIENVLNNHTAEKNIDEFKRQLLELTPEKQPDYCRIKTFENNPEEPLVESFFGNRTWGINIPGRKYYILRSENFIEDVEPEE